MSDDSKGSIALHHFEQTEAENLADANNQDGKLRAVVGIPAHVIAALDSEKIERDNIVELIAEEEDLISKWNALQIKKADQDDLWREKRMSIVPKVESYFDNDILAMTELGYQTYKKGKGQAHELPAAPLSLKAKNGLFPGEADLKCKKIKYANWYEFYICDATKDPNIDANWTVLAKGGTCTAKAYNIERVKKFFIKAHASTTKGFGPFCDYIEFTTL